jgi:hypothetical protein
MGVSDRSWVNGKGSRLGLDVPNGDAELPRAAVGVVA